MFNNGGRAGAMTDKTEIALGISACLLGEKVRYDGQAKLNIYLRDTLGAFVRYIPVCPEVGCGLPIPRDAMRLVGDPENPRLVTIRTGTDHTERMRRWIDTALELLAKGPLHGFIFKSGSPSSGMRDVKIYNAKGFVAHRGAGLFAKAFMERFPMLPVEDEGRLQDPDIRENFIERVFIFARWSALVRDDKTVRGLITFHARHKLLFMARSPEATRELGRIVANKTPAAIDALFATYLETMTRTLKLKATVRKNVNVLLHVLGYFKRVLSAEEKAEALEAIEQYRRELIPLIVPVTLLRHYAKKFRDPYLSEQYFLAPCPAELKLRNHV